MSQIIEAFPKKEQLKVVRLIRDKYFDEKGIHYNALLVRNILNKGTNPEMTTIALKVIDEYKEKKMKAATAKRVLSRKVNKVVSELAEVS